MSRKKLGCAFLVFLRFRYCCNNRKNRGVSSHNKNVQPFVMHVTAKTTLKSIGLLTDDIIVLSCIAVFVRHRVYDDRIIIVAELAHVSHQRTAVSLFSPVFGALTGRVR